jgi:hypothetical protein
MKQVFHGDSPMQPADKAHLQGPSSLLFRIKSALVCCQLVYHVAVFHREKAVLAGGYTSLPFSM